MKKRKWAAALMSMALATAMISGCSVIKEEISHSIYQPQINPLAGQNISETITSNFYYVVEGENQLASVSQTIDVASGETREEAGAAYAAARAAAKHGPCLSTAGGHRGGVCILGWANLKRNDEQPLFNEHAGGYVGWYGQ